MRRRDWVLVLGAGLSASLLPACSARPLARQASSSARPEAKLGTPEEAPPTVAAVRSPYNLLPLLPDAAEEEQTAKEAAVEPAYFPVQDTLPGRLSLDAVEAPTPQPLSKSLEPGAVGPPMEEPPLIQALRCIQEKRPAEAVQRLAGYDKPNQEVLLALMPLAVRLTERSLTRINPQEMAMMVDQLESLIDPLRKRSALSIEKMCFCRKIEGFGNYEPLPDDYYFQPGKTVLVYLQLRNFSCEPEDGAYVTRLVSTVEVKNFNGTYKRRAVLPAQTESSKELRHDYFSRYRFIMWNDIPPGLYTLTIRVVDQPDTPRQRAAERSLEFRVTARNRLEEMGN